MVLNTARFHESAQARQELARLTDADTGIDWPAVVALAARIGAPPALRAGLELTEEGSRVVADTPLRDVAASRRPLA